MRRTILLATVFTSGVACFGQDQPDNVAIGLFKNGTNGSNAVSGANIEVSLKPINAVYTPTPVAEGFTLYVIGPKAAGFTTGDGLAFNQVNAALYGGGTMLAQPPFDIGDANIYYPIVLSAPLGLNLNTMTTVGAWGYAFTFSFNPVKSPAQYNQVRIIDQTNNAALTAANAETPLFSTLRIGGNNQLTAGTFTVLPASLLNFSGYKNGTRNNLRWTTASEQNNAGFEVQRSSDGLNYSTIGFVNTLANGGNSFSELNYVFDDNSPVVSKKQYYRLSQRDLDGNGKLSNIVTIKGDRSTEFMIDGLFPNPARDKVNIIINAPKKDDVTLVLMDAAGKTVKREVANVDMGSNTVQLDVASLSSGSYFVKVLCRSLDCQSATTKFNKQ